MKKSNATMRSHDGIHHLYNAFFAFIMIASTSLLTGCQNMDIADYKNSQPTFIVEDYFVGKVKAWGMFQNRSGQVMRRFTVDIKGTYENDTLTLVEDFNYHDGEKDQRIWTIKKLDANTYEGRADDVVGVARGERQGNTLNWQYTLDLPYKDSTIKVQFDDWMFLQDDNVLINRAQMRKFGIRVGEVTLFFYKP